MKTIGLLGGMSWESTALYYRWINEGVNEKLGQLHSAKLVMISVDFQEIEHLQHAHRWEKAGRLLAAYARQIQVAGADFLLLCTNTMHKVADAIEEAIDIPFLHIADATAEAIKQRGISTVGLLGTRFTMEEAFYAQRLQEKHGLTVLVPEEADRDLIHRVIYQELVKGIINERSRNEYLTIIHRLIQRGAEGIIAGCTEIGMLIQQQHIPVPLFDTAYIHARRAVEMALGEPA